MFSVRNAIVVSFVSVLLGCAATNPLPARLYDLADASVIEVQFSNFRDGHGTALARLTSGEKLSGEYTLPQTNDVTRRAAVGGGDFRIQAAQAAGAAIPGKDDLSWQEVYGYAKDATAKPVGAGTLVGDRGTVLSLVFSLPIPGWSPAAGSRVRTAGTGTVSTWAWLRNRLSKFCLM